MKKILEKLRIKTLVKVIICIVGVCFMGVFTSCENMDYTSKTVIEFNKMEKPVVLFAKSKDYGEYRVTLIDGEGKIHQFGNVSTLANNIGEIYKVGDTLK